MMKKICFFIASLFMITGLHAQQYRHLSRLNGGFYPIISGNPIKEACEMAERGYPIESSCQYLDNMLNKIGDHPMNLAMFSTDRPSQNRMAKHPEIQNEIQRYNRGATQFSLLIDVSTTTYRYWQIKSCIDTILSDKNLSDAKIVQATEELEDLAWKIASEKIKRRQS
jgi:hypothetical protein